MKFSFLVFSLASAISNDQTRWYNVNIQRAKKIVRSKIFLRNASRQQIEKYCKWRTRKENKKNEWRWWTSEWKSTMMKVEKKCRRSTAKAKERKMWSYICWLHKWIKLWELNFCKRCWMRKWERVQKKCNKFFFLSH